MAVTKISSTNMKAELTTKPDGNMSFSIDDKSTKIYVEVVYKEGTLRSYSEKRAKENVSVDFYENGKPKTVTFGGKKHTFVEDELAKDDSELEMKRMVFVTQFSAVNIQSEITDRFGEIINTLTKLHN